MRAIFRWLFTQATRGVLGQLIKSVLEGLGIWKFVVAVPIGVYGAVIAMTEGLQSVALAVLFVITAAALAILHYGALKYERFREKYFGQGVISERTPILDEAPYPDLKLSDFVRSHLGIANLAPDPESRIGHFLHSIREAALQKRIQIWGRRDCEEDMADLALIVIEIIPSSYWRNCKINEFEFVTKNGWAVTAQDGNNYCEYYGDLQVSRQQVEKIWPAASI